MTNSFTESITRFKFIAGLDDKDIKEDILSMPDKSLEETVKCVESKESGKVARLKVGVSDAKVSVVKTEDTFNSPRGVKRCKNCNRTGHSSNPKDREKSCPAWGKICDKCGKEGHYKIVCKSDKRQSTSNKVTGEADNMMVGTDKMSWGAMAGLMMTMATVNKFLQESNKVRIPHMLYEQLQWI